MKVALIFPRFREKFKESISLIEPPLGICYLAAVLRKNKIDVKIFDGVFETEEEIIEKMKVYKPNIIGVGFMTVMADDVFSFLKKVRVDIPYAKIVVGGPHPTVLPEETIKKDFVDIVAIGEGEITMLDIAKNLDNLKSVKGIFFKNNGEIIKNQDRDFIKDIDTLPYPAYDLLDPRSLKNLDKVVMCSRGCVFNCAFCQPTLNKLFGRLRMRNPKKVVDEIEYLVKKYNTKSILFHDDTMTFDKKWLIRFCKEMIRRKIKISWICNSRVNTIDEERLKYMKMAGCNLVAFGVESGSDRIRNEILNKNITKEQIKNAFDLCHKFKIKTFGYFMVGSPYETKDTLNETIKLVKEIKPEIAGVTITTPIPGTYLFERCKKNGLLNANNYSDYDWSEKITIKNKNINKEDLEYVRNKIKSLSVGYYIKYCITTLKFKELFQELFREPKRILRVGSQILKSI